jgi:hypothetical protein
MNRFSVLDPKFKAAEKPKETKAAPAPRSAVVALTPDCADMKCSRCGRVDHYAKDCKLPFTRSFTRAEMRAKNETEKAQRMAQKEARQAEYEKKQAEFERKHAARAERQAEWAERQAQREAGKPGKRGARVAQEWDTRSDISLASTAVSATSALTKEHEMEVQALVARDKEVRRLDKLLREIAKLEQCTDLDVLQRKKVSRKSELEIERESASGLAAARARNQVQHQIADMDKMD